VVPFYFRMSASSFVYAVCLVNHPYLTKENSDNIFEYLLYYLIMKINWNKVVYSVTIKSNHTIITKNKNQIMQIFNAFLGYF